jgi:hypothetical protein
LLLFGSENLAKFFANVGVELLELLALLVGQTQILASERRKNRRRTGWSDATVAAWCVTSRCVTVGATAIGGSAIGTSAIGWTAICARTVATCFFADSPITRAPVGWTTIRRTVSTCARTIAGDVTVTAWQVTGTVRSELVFGQLAVAVFVQLFERLGGRLDFFGRKHAIVVGVECLEERPAQRRGTVATKLAPRAAARPVRGLSDRRCCYKNEESNADQPAEMASHGGSPKGSESGPKHAF